MGRRVAIVYKSPKQAYFHAMAYFIVNLQQTLQTSASADRIQSYNSGMRHVTETVFVMNCILGHQQSRKPRHLLNSVALMPEV